MLVSRLLRSLLRYFTLGIVPDEGGGAAPAPDAGTPAPPAAPAEPVASTPAPESADQFGGLMSALDAVGGEPGAGSAAQPAPAPSQARDPSGQFASKSQAAAGVAAVPAPPAAAAPQVPPAPKPGEMDLTAPEGITPRAAERWTQLTERVKQLPELERRVTEATTALDSVRRMVSDSGLAPNEFTDMLQMGRGLKSSNPQDMQRALQQLDGMRADLAMRLGVDVPGVDQLAQHPDLQQKVEGMLITREDALEIARLRQGNQQAQRSTQEQREAQQFQQTVQGAAASMEQTLRQRIGTPGHEAKLQYIHGHFANPQNLQAFVNTYRPDQWKSVVLTMYDAYTPQAAVPVPPPGPQPLRPRNTQTGAPVNTGPVTAESAVGRAFAAAGL